MKARKINGIVAVVVFVALAGNAFCESNGWALVGNIFGWAIIVAALWMVVDNKIKEREQL